MSVDAVVYYRVSNPTMATNNIEDYRYVIEEEEAETEQARARSLNSE